MKQRSRFVPILGGFVPLAALWDEGANGALFPSEASARWYIRSNREALVEAEALAMHAGRLLVHVPRFETVAQRVAIQHAARREAT